MRRALPLAAAALILLLGPLGAGRSGVRVARADEPTLEDPGDEEDAPDAPPESDDEGQEQGRGRHPDQGDGHGRPRDDLNGGSEELPTEPAAAPSPRDAEPETATHA